MNSASKGSATSGASTIEETVSMIGPVDEGARTAACAHLDRLTKPPGSLGRLEELAAHLSAITGRAAPLFAQKTVFVFAADHGVAAESVSAYPAEVTMQMTLNFLRGGAAINVLARHAGASVVVADFGVREPVIHPSIVSARIGPGTANAAAGPAMSREQAEEALAAGIGILAREASMGCSIAATGDMGIGNTTSASALTALFAGAAPDGVTGRGTGLDDAGRRHKVGVVERMLAVNRPDPADPIGASAALGGFEILGLAGVILGAAARRMPVVIDGFISGAAALVAVAIAPLCREYLIAAHRSAEPGHDAALHYLGLHPLLDLGLRLGEGTGAALALSLVDAAVAIRDEMATFDEAEVSGSL